MADYFVEGDEVLENKLNIIDPTKLKEIEEAFVAREGMCIIEEDCGRTFTILLSWNICIDGYLERFTRLLGKFARLI